VELLQRARSAVVVRVEQVALKPQPDKDIVITPDVEAKVRVTELLFGKPAGVRTLDFSNNWCGGHDLKVGDYYVLLLRDASETVMLVPGDESIVYLFDEYREPEGSKASASALLMQLRNFVRLGSFPDAFPIEKYLDRTRAHPPPLAPR
jgi:hypothetical protein